MSLVTFGANLSSLELAELSGFSRRQIPRKADRSQIPAAAKTAGGHWKFRVTHNLRAWICFYRVRNTLLRKQRSYRENEIFKGWGTEWEYALEAFDFLRCFRGFTAECGKFGVFQLGPDVTWEAVEAVVLELGIMPREGWREDLDPRPAIKQ
jgi:hypothetical protein